MIYVTPFDMIFRVYAIRFAMYVAYAMFRLRCLMAASALCRCHSYRLRLLIDDVITPPRLRHPCTLKRT